MRDREHPPPPATQAAPPTPVQPPEGHAADHPGHAGHAAGHATDHTGHAADHPGHASHAAGHATSHHAPHQRRAGVATGDLLYLSAMLLSSLWAAVLLFVVYPQSPVDAGFTDDDVPVMSVQGNVVTVKRAGLEEALESHRYLAASKEQVDYFNAQRAATLAAVKRDKLFWFVAAAAFPGVGLLLLRLWSRAQRRG